MDQFCNESFLHPRNPTAGASAEPGNKAGAVREQTPSKFDVLGANIEYPFINQGSSWETKGG